MPFDAPREPGDWHRLDCRGIDPDVIQRFIHALADGIQAGKDEEAATGLSELPTTPSTSTSS